jgi:hypothetical protein
MDTAPATATPETPAAEAAPIHDAPSPRAMLKARLEALQARAAALRTRALELRAKAQELPAVTRARALALVERVRVALDLPSRTEIAELTARLDKLDARIAELTGAPAPAVVATLPEGVANDAAVPEQSRKDKKRNHAAKMGRR